MSAYVSRVSSEPSPVRRLEPVLWGEREGGVLRAPELDAYERDGFLLEERLLDTDRLASLDAEFERLVETSDPADERVIREPEGNAVRSLFQVHEMSPEVDALARSPEILDRVEQILGSPVYIHQSRVNLKPGLRGKEFFWHSDFETWHFEDGMPEMRAVSVSINLTENRPDNGALMIMPGSHRSFVGCVGRTPEDHYRESLRAQNYGVPSDRALAELAERHGIEQMVAPPGSAVFFDSNCMHGSNSNITPYPRRNLFVVYNSVENTLVEPFGGTAPRPGHIASREPVQLR